MTETDSRYRLHPGADYPQLNQKANGAVRVEVGTSRGPSGDGAYVSMVVRDHASGETLVSVQIAPEQMWLLCQGGSQTWPAFISPHLERVGKRMQNERVHLPPAVEGDTDRDTDRDVWRAVHEQLPEDWHDWGGVYDTPRVDNTRTRYTIVRRWVPA